MNSRRLSSNELWHFLWRKTFFQFFPNVVEFLVKCSPLKLWYLVRENYFSLGDNLSSWNGIDNWSIHGICNSRRFSRFSFRSFVYNAIVQWFQWKACRGRAVACFQVSDQTFYLKHFFFTVSFMTPKIDINLWPNQMQNWFEKLFVCFFLTDKPSHKEIATILNLELG